MWVNEYLNLVKGELFCWICIINLMKLDCLCHPRKTLSITNFNCFMPEGGYTDQILYHTVYKCAYRWIV